MRPSPWRWEEEDSKLSLKGTKNPSRPQYGTEDRFLEGMDIHNATTRELEGRVILVCSTPYALRKLHTQSS
jgi:hypothetical protein